MVTVGYSNPEVLTYNTYISYDLLSLIGEVGGILGLTMGISVLTLLESLLQHIHYYWNKYIFLSNSCLLKTLFADKEKQGKRE